MARKSNITGVTGPEFSIGDTLLRATNSGLVLEIPNQPPVVLGEFSELGFSVRYSDVSTPESTPNEGDSYIVATGGTGAWSGHDGEIARSIGNNWVFFQPEEGWRVWDEEQDKTLVWTGTEWLHEIAQNVMSEVLANDGPGSGLDADTLDGLESAQLLRSDIDGSITGTLSVESLITSGIYNNTNLSIGSTGNITFNVDTDNNILDEKFSFKINNTTEIFSVSNNSLNYKGSKLITETRTINSGHGIVGGGDLSVDRTLDVSFAGLGTGVAPVNSDTIAFWDGTLRSRSIGDLITDFNIVTSDNPLGVDAGTLDGLDSTAFARTERNINTGIGLGGGGNLSSDRNLFITTSNINTGTITNSNEVVFWTDHNTPKKTTLSDFISDLNIATLDSPGTFGSTTFSGDIILANGVDILPQGANALGKLLQPLTSASITELRVGDGTEISPSVAFISDLNTGLYRPTEDTIAFTTNANKRLEINNSGIIVKGNLIVEGTTFQIDSNTVNIGDNIIVLNSDETGVPSQDGGFEIERGTLGNVKFIWNELDDRFSTVSSPLHVGGNFTVDGNTTLSGVVNGRTLSGVYDKLDGIESNATADMTANEILSSLSSVDGSGSGLDADTVDGVHLSGLVQTSRTINTGGGISGGGDLSSDRTLSIDFDSLDSTNVIDLNDDLMYSDSSADNVVRKRNLFAIITELGLLRTIDTGHGNGLDADTVDGIQGSQLVLNSVSINTNNESGLGGGGTLEDSLNLFLDFNTLEVEKPVTSDYIVFSDVSDSNNTKRRLISNLITDLGILTYSDTGHGNGLDADTVDGIQGSSILVTNANKTYSGILTSTVSGGLRFSATGNSGWRTFGHTDGSLNFSIDNTGGSELSLHADGISSSTAELRVNSNKVWHSGNDGSGSGLNADLLDGLDGTSYARSSRIVGTQSGSGLSGGGNLLSDKFLALTNQGVGVDLASGPDEVLFFKNNLLKKTNIADLISELDIATLTSAQQTFTGDLVISGNLVVHGDTTTINTTELNVADNIIVLNSDVTALPTENAGIEIERGLQPNATLLWDEALDRWKGGISGSEYELLTTNSVINADTLGGLSNSSFVRSDVSDEMAGTLTVTTDNLTKNLVLSNGTDNFEISAYNNEFRLGEEGNTQLRFDGTKCQVGSDVIWYDILHKGNAGAGSGLDADTLDGVQLSGLVQTDREITTDSGSGLYGGGNLSTNRSFRLSTIGITSSVAANSGSILFFTDSATVKQRSIPSFLSDNFVWTANNDGAGSGLDADTVDGVQLSGLVQTARTISTGNGLVGGGDLSQNRTIEISLDAVSVENIAGASTLAFFDNDVIKKTGVSDFISQLGILTTSDEGTGNGLDADTVDGVHLSGLVQPDRAINTDTGLMGGGDLSQNRTIALDFVSLNSLEPVAEADSFILYDSSTGNAIRRTTDNLISDLGLWSSGNDGTGSGLDADTVDGIQASSFVQVSRTINTINGISGGGSLSDNLTLELDISTLGSTSITTNDSIIFKDVSAADITRSTTVTDFISDLQLARKNIDETFSGNVTISGNLIVNGETTTINTTELSVEDPEITLAKNQTGNPTLDSGIRINRGDEPDALIRWDETANGWLFGIEGNMKLLFVPGAENVTNADTLDGLDSTAFVQTTRQLVTGLGISGGGDLSQNRSLSLSSTGLQYSSIATADELIFFDTDDGLLPKKRNLADALSDLNVLTTANEGAGNNLDADTLDGLEATQFIRSDADDITTGSITISRNQSGLNDYSLVVDSSSNFSSIKIEAGDYASSYGVSLNAWRHAFGDEDFSNIYFGHDGTELRVLTGGVKVENGSNFSELGTDGNIELTRGSSGSPTGYIDFKGDISDDFDIRLQSTSTGLNLSDQTEVFASINNSGIILGSGTPVSDGLYIKNNNTDTNIWRIDDGSSNFGFYQKYTGLGSGNNNNLELWSQNQNGTDVLINKILQDGRVVNNTKHYYHNIVENYNPVFHRKQSNIDFSTATVSTGGNKNQNYWTIDTPDELISSPDTNFDILFSGVLTDGVGVVTSNVSDPRGNNKAATIEMSSGTFYFREYDTGIVPLSNTTYDYSLLAKVVSGRTFNLEIWVGNADNTFEIVYDTMIMQGTDISSGNVSADSNRIVNLTDNWYLCSLSFTTNGSPSGNIIARVGTRSNQASPAVATFAYPSITNSRKSLASFYNDDVSVFDGRIKLGGSERPTDIIGTSMDNVVVGDLADTETGIVLHGTTASGIVFADTDTSIGGDSHKIRMDHDNNIMTLEVAGVSVIELLAGGLRSGASGGPALRHTSSSSTNPGFTPNRGDTNTGIGWGGADQLSLITNSIERINISNDTTTINNTLYVSEIQGNDSSNLTLQPAGGDINISRPARLNFQSDNQDFDFLRIGKNDSNDYGYFFRYTGSGSGADKSLELYSENQVGADLRILSVNQDGITQFDKIVKSATAGSWLLSDNVPSSTVPSIIPNNTDTDTGIGHTAADTLSLIAGGVKVIDANSSGVVKVANSAGTWGNVQTKHIDALTDGSLALAFYSGSSVSIGSVDNDIELNASKLSPVAGTTGSYLGTTSNPYNKVWLSSGTEALPSIGFGGDDNTGIYSPSADELAITLGGTKVAHFSGNDLTITGTLFATDKSFLIDHPTLPDKKLRHGSLEGPENGIYVRGKVPEDGVITLPDYWQHIVDEDSITVSLTPVGSYQKLFIESVDNNKIVVRRSSWGSSNINAFYMINGERNDTKKLEIVVDKRID